MKKRLFSFLIILGLLFGNSAIGSSDFTCSKNIKDFPREWGRALQKKYIKKKTARRFLQICSYGKTVYFLREDTAKKGQQRVRGGIYFTGEKNGFLEKQWHAFLNTCEISPKSVGEIPHITYFCYNATVAAEQTAGIKYTFFPGIKKVKQEKCTVSFSQDSPGENSCRE